MSEPAKKLLPFKPAKPKAFAVKSRGAGVTIKVYPAWKDGELRSTPDADCGDVDGASDMRK